MCDTNAKYAKTRKVQLRIDKMMSCLTQSCRRAAAQRQIVPDDVCRIAVNAYLEQDDQALPITTPATVEASIGHRSSGHQCDASEKELSGEKC